MNMEIMRKHILLFDVNAVGDVAMELLLSGLH